VPQPAIAHEPADPVNICLLGLQAVMQITQAFSHLVQQANGDNAGLNCPPDTLPFTALLSLDIKTVWHVEPSQARLRL
jgi:hypothetical protein